MLNPWTSRLMHWYILKYSFWLCCCWGHQCFTNIFFYFQTYGYEHLLTLLNLEKAGLIRLHGQRTYPTIRKSLRLIIDDINEQVWQTMIYTRVSINYTFSNIKHFKFSNCCLKYMVKSIQCHLSSQLLWLLLIPWNGLLIRYCNAALSQSEFNHLAHLHQTLHTQTLTRVSN